MSEALKREAARQIINKWSNKGKEDEDCRSFWIDILQRIFDVKNATDHIEFEKKVIVDGNTKRIDAYLPETKVLIEQKSLDIALDQKYSQSGGILLSPYEQAKRYNDNLPYEMKARWIIVSNFAEIWIYDMNVSVPKPDKIKLSDLREQFHKLDFLINEEVKKVSQETALSIQAGELVGKIHDRFQDQYTDPLAKHTQRSLNILCVRLVFCLYAEDAGLFGESNEFTNYISQYEAKDVRQALINLFKVLDTPENERAELYLDDELSKFPYVNGGLFKDESIVIPRITDEIKQTILDSANFNWSQISPTIFGAVFESTLNLETRRSGGMHYTSIENIHKVIDPLFLDEINNEFVGINKIQIAKDKEKKLREFQDKISKLKFLDPACGSGNFLTETYTCLRRIENKIISELEHDQIVLGEAFNPIKVSICQFYGIEINDFAVTVAKAALWIAESQMMKETEDVVHMNLDFLPLKTNANIIEANALQIDWEQIVPKNELNFIIGNPPFVGARLMSSEQKNDLFGVFGENWKNAGNLDYVACWYKKCSDYMKASSIHAALVSTNSICQGEQVSILWKSLFLNGLTIEFAYKTFIWDSEANIKAHVHCIIVGFSYEINDKTKLLFDGTELKKTECDNINAYLVDAPNVFIENRSIPISNIPKLLTGCQRLDGDNFIFSPEEKLQFIKKEPLSSKYFYKWIGAEEFINNKERWCLWLKGCSPVELKQMPSVINVIEKVRTYRQNSNRAQTKKYADRPTEFYLEVCSESDFLLIPVVSSERRRYIPIGFMKPGILCSNQANIIPNAKMYHFGVLQSNVHMAWVRAVCGRIKSDYRYSKDIVYNNFPWPTPTDEQKAKIEATAQAILDARALYHDCSLADLYDPLTMPPELRKAHQENDKAVMRAYGFDIKTTSEADCVAELFKLYQALIEEN